MRLTRCLVAVAAVVAFASTWAQAQGERIGIGWSMGSDGSCSVAARTLLAEYERTSAVSDIIGRVRLAPSGGDCRVQSQSYQLSADRWWTMGAVDLMLEVGVNKQTLFSPYDREDPARPGHVLRREDGGAELPNSFPVGSPHIYTGAVGVSRDFGGLRAGAGVNLIPVPWAEYDAGPTLRLSSGYSAGGLGVDAAVDWGAANYGEVAANYRFAIDQPGFDDIGIGSVFRWGLNAIAPRGESPRVIGYDSYIHHDGGPQGYSWHTNVTFGFANP